MENEYKYEDSYIDDAVIYAKNAITYSEGLNSKLDDMVSLASKVEVENLDYSQVGNIKTIINDFSTLDTDIQNIKKEALSVYLTKPNFQYEMIHSANSGELSPVDTLEIASDYMKNLVASDPNYYKSLKETTSIHNMLKEQGFSDEYIDSLNSAFCEYLIRNNLMYTREGIVEMTYLFNGLLAMYGYRLDYRSGTGTSESYFDNINHGLYLGTKNNKLQMLDCCNYYDWLSRCVGIDMYAYAAGGHYKYGIDVEGYANATIKEEYKAYPDDEYYYNARPGDIMEGDGHLRIIIAKTDTGYLTTEEGSNYSAMIIKHYTFKELAKKGYHISNMDAVYRNTSSGAIGIFKQDKYIPKAYIEEIRNARAIRGNGIFFSPKELAAELNLSPALENELIKQYNARNEHPLVAKISEIDVPDNEQIVVNPNPVTPENTTPSTTVKPENIGSSTVVRPGNVTSSSLNTKVNILPNNKFSNYLPSIASGTLGRMEISQKSVSYQVLNINSNIYEKYTNSLIEQGYTMTSQGIYTKGNMEVTATISQEGKEMNISLRIIE